MINFLSNIKKRVIKYDYAIILCFSVIFSLTSFLYFYDQGLITAYGDSRAHSNISRRVVDSITPGMAQLGGSWLPLLHVLMLPTIWNDFLWHSGISGSLVNIPAYIIGMCMLYKLVFEITGKRFNAIVAFLATSLNVNILYFQTTPMGEMLFISTLILSLYFIFRWYKTERFSYLVTSGFFFFLSSINRYEGWFVAMGAVLAVAIVSLTKFRWKKTEGNLILFSTVALSGIASWLLWQWVIFGYPLDFLRNEFAAGVYTARDIKVGIIPTYRDLPVSTLTQLYASFHTSGVILTIGGLVAIILHVAINHVNLFKSQKFILLIGAIPFLFEILASFMGNVPMYVPEIRVIDKVIPDYFNVRYALYSLPVLVIFLTTVTRKTLLVLGLLVLLLINNALLLPIMGNPKILVLKDNGIVSSSNLKPQAWFRSNYDNGLILVSAASSDVFIFGTNLNMKKFISEGSRKYWRESMSNPSKYVRWVIFKDDAKGKDSLLNHLDMIALNKDFDLQEKSAGYRFYKVKENLTFKSRDASSAPRARDLN